MTLNNVLIKERDFVVSHGGYANLTEFDNGINDIQREKIAAAYESFGQCFLGKINYYGDDKENINNLEILKAYQGQKIYNFEYDFFVPTHDEKLIELIKGYNKGAGNSLQMIKQIYARVTSLKGDCLTWV